MKFVRGLAFLCLLAIFVAFNDGNDTDESDSPTKCHCGKFLLKDMEDWSFFEMPLENAENGGKNSILLEQKTMENGPEHGELLIRANVKTILAADDNLILHAHPLGGRHFVAKCVAIKIVRFEELRADKPRDLVEHELDMLKMARERRIGSVVELIGGYALENAVFFVLELGQMDLEKYMEKEMNPKSQTKLKRVFTAMAKALANVHKCWHMKKKMNPKSQTELKRVFTAMAKALAGVHEFALHNALKPSNWLVMESAGPELVLKLIDLQTAVPVDGQGRVEGAWEYRKFICKAWPRSHFSRARRLASPELAALCGTILKSAPNLRPGLSKWQKYGHAVMPRHLTTKSDIWSLGVVFCQILSLTPAFLARKWRNLAKLKPFELLLNAFALGRDGQGILAFIQADFPFIYSPLKAIFQFQADQRPSAKVIWQYLERNKDGVARSEPIQEEEHSEGHIFESELKY